MLLFLGLLSFLNFVSLYRVPSLFSTSIIRINSKDESLLVIYITVLTIYLLPCNGINAFMQAGNLEMYLMTKLGFVTGFPKHSNLKLAKQTNE